eukprot:gb/GEZN01004467.1/.p1 GENE.gb/GEZN01004467.1/~~gb/GEZN01004467.1/.p1  ORF type:complete len:602 (-),score=71.49 gb/GEZN01004467.1/:156-1763(-)
MTVSRTSRPPLEMSQRYFRLFSIKQLIVIGNIINSAWFQLCILTLLLVDLFLFIIELALPHNTQSDENVFSVTVFICAVLVCEVTLRLLWMDVKPFFKDPGCVFDFIVSYLSFLLTFYSHYAGGALILLRLARYRIVRYLSVRCVRFWGMGVWRGKALPRALQAKISSNRNRFQEEGWDLDITYITDRVLAMSAPKVGAKGTCQNSEDEVARFFNNRYNQDEYLIFNTAPEANYDYKKFNNRLREYFLDDHDPAPLSQILQCVKEMKTFLDMEPNHAVCVHSMGGRGRTGVVISSFLMYYYPSIFPDADSALMYFAKTRTAPTESVREGEGGDSKESLPPPITITQTPSQQRYVRYFEELLAQPSWMENMPRPTKLLSFIRVFAVSHISKEFWRSIWFVVRKDRIGVKDSIIGDLTADLENPMPLKEAHSGTSGGTVPPDALPQFAENHDQKLDWADFIPSTPIPISGDCHVSFYAPGNKPGEELFGLWLHTGLEPMMENPLTFLREDVDGTRDDKEGKNFTADFRVELHFEATL